jgi:hypothetical protein
MAYKTQLKISLILTFCLAFLVLGSAVEASHYRGGTVRYRQKGISAADQKVALIESSTFYANGSAGCHAWTSAGGYAMTAAVGTIDTSPVDYDVANCTVELTLPSNTSTDTLTWDSGNRIGGLQNGMSNTNWRLKVSVRLRAVQAGTQNLGNSSAITYSAPVVKVIKGGIKTFSLPGTDTDILEDGTGASFRDNVQFFLGGTAEFASSTSTFTNPPGLSINQTTGEITWNTDSAASGLHPIGVLVKDFENATSSEVGFVPIEFMLDLNASVETIATSDVVRVSPDVVIEAKYGIPVPFEVEAMPKNSGRRTIVEVLTSPLGSTVTLSGADFGVPQTHPTTNNQVQHRLYTGLGSGFSAGLYQKEYPVLLRVYDDDGSGGTPGVSIFKLIYFKFALPENPIWFGIPF